MERQIYKSAITHDRDSDVPEFGGYSSAELRFPEVRKIKPDVFGSDAIQELWNSAVRRPLCFAYGLGEIPYVHFPNAEHFQHFPFTHEHWEQYGNMESEYSKIRFMLNMYRNRRFPQVFDQICRVVISEADVLKAWNKSIPVLDKASVMVYEEALGRMNQQKVHDDFNYSNGEQGAYQSKPFFYESSDAMKGIELGVWERALDQIVDELKSGNFRNISIFLHVYNRIKDPVTPIRSILAEQSRIFLELYKQAKGFIPNRGFNVHQEKVLVAQLALESSFLALPAVEDISFVVYSSHHELPYVYVDITQLPRGEFANPEQVEVVIFGNKNKGINGMVNDFNEHGEAVLTPITISYFQEPNQAKPELFIVDGNNRAVALLLMKYFDFLGFSKKEVLEANHNLRKFIALYNLPIEWERDLALAIKHFSNGAVLDKLLDNQEVLQGCAHGQFPALLVQESNFHTIAVPQSLALAQLGKKGIVVLQPIHQAIYNQSRYSMAIPAKQQSHGRAAGNDFRISLKQL